MDKAGIYQNSKRPVEYLSDRRLGFIDEQDFKFYKVCMFTNTIDYNCMQSRVSCLDPTVLVTDEAKCTDDSSLLKS